jgi:hypothetical protein
MLYWAEGAKARNCLKLTNSDPGLLAFFRQFLIESLQVEPTDITLRVNVYLGNGLSLEQIESYWLDQLELPRSSARSHTVNHFPTSSSGRKRNKLPYGVCSLAVYQTRLVQHIFGAIQEYAGFDEPRWLDCDPVEAGSTSA